MTHKCNLKAVTKSEFIQNCFCENIMNLMDGEFRMLGLRLRCIYCAKNINPQSMIVKNTLLDPRGLDGFVGDGTFHWERNPTPNANLYFNVCIKWRITINGSSITFRIQGIGMNRISTTKFSLVERLTDRLKTALKEIRRTFRCNSPQHPALFKENSIKGR